MRNNEFPHNRRVTELSTSVHVEMIGISVTYNGIARALPGGRVAHPEGQNEEENEVLPPPPEL